MLHHHLPCYHYPIFGVALLHLDHSGMLSVGTNGAQT